MNCLRHELRCEPIACKTQAATNTAENREIAKKEKSMGSFGKFKFTKVVFDTVEFVMDMQINSKKVERELADVACLPDVCYSKRFPEMKLDLYFMPHTDNKKQPVILEIHGGGFSGGDKKYRRCLCRSFAKNTGATVINVNYGLGESSPCPIPMQQLADAVNWVVENADLYMLDLSKFVVTGDSAGAYYACFLAVLQDSEFLQNLFQCKLNTRITATMLNCGVYDMKHALNSPIPMKNGICRDLTGQDLKEAQESRYFAGLTLTDFVTENFPPTLLIYSKNDLLCQGQGEIMLRKLQQNAVPTECICAKSLLDNHVYCLLGITTMAKETNRYVFHFLKKHFES